MRIKSEKQNCVRFLSAAVLVVMFVVFFQTTLLGGEEEKNRSAPPFTVSIELKEGWSSWALDDFGKSKKYFEDLNALPGYSAATKDLSGSLYSGLGLTLEYNLPNSHKLGLSAGYRYLPGGPFDQSYTDDSWTMSSNLDLSGFTMPLELSYKVPAGENFFIKAGGGIDFYNLEMDYGYIGNFSGTGYSYRGTFKDSGLGGHVNLGAEFNLNDNLALNFNAGYSFAKLDDFTGTLADKHGMSSDMLLIMVEDEFGDVMGIYPTTEPLPPDYRPLELDTGGWNFSIGFKYSFKKKGVQPVPGRIPGVFVTSGITGEDEATLGDKLKEKIAGEHKTNSIASYKVSQAYKNLGEAWWANGEGEIAVSMATLSEDPEEAKEFWKKAEKKYSDAKKSFEEAAKKWRESGSLWNDAYKSWLEVANMWEARGNKDEAKTARAAAANYAANSAGAPAKAAHAKMCAAACAVKAAVAKKKAGD